jgi:hypothetical protein
MEKVPALWMRKSRNDFIDIGENLIHLTAKIGF